MAPRLDTPLSRALLESGSLDPSALEDAIQEQVIHGGALDTILLEKGAVDERRLAELLCKAWGTEPVSLDEIEQPAVEAARVLPERMALTMRLCPFRLEAGAEHAGLHVLCAAPLDRGLLDEVSVLLARPLLPHVVPEVRLWQALQRAYGVAPDERFAALLTDLNVPARARASASDAPLSDEGGESDERDVSDPGAAKWDLVEALAHLAAQESRDGIARVATSYARRFLPFAAMIGIRRVEGRAQCVGWLRSGPAEGVQFHNKPFGVPEDSVLEGALQSPSPSLGKPQITPGNAALFGWLGRRRPRTFLVVPIVVAQKTIGALVADGGIRARDFGTLSELVAFAARLGPAFEALLRQRHKQHPSLFPQAASPSETVPVPVPAPPPEPAPAVLTPASKLSDAPKPRVSFEAEVTAPLPHFGKAPASTDGVPAPPPMLPVPPTQPRPVTLTAMPRVDLAPPPREARDGTSPFARNYVASKLPEPAVAEPPPPPPPPAPTPAPATHVVEDLSGLSRVSALVPEQTVHQAPRAAPDDAAFAEVTDTHATSAWREALVDAVARGHQGGTVSPEEKAQLFLDDEEGWEDVRYDAASAAADAAARATAAITMPVLAELARAGELDEKDGEALATLSDGAPVTEEEPPTPSQEAQVAVEELVDELEARDDRVVLRARALVLERGEAAIPALAARFPGRLAVDPFDPGEMVRVAIRLGPLVDVLYALGTRGLDAAIPHLDSRYPAHRYAAVLLFALTPDPRGIDLLRARLHDQEPRIRQLAADALAPFVAHGRFEAVLVHLRERLSSPLLDARRRAVQLLGTFRDVGAVPTLIALLDARGAGELVAPLVEDSRQALRLITLQDFGVRAKGWEKWWQKAKKRSRVDWLIEGLSSEDRELRSVASVELGGLAGDDFGYHPDAPRKLRQKAVVAFQGWWADEQKRAQPKAG